jgi:hypothetical protein
VTDEPDLPAVDPAGTAPDDVAPHEPLTERQRAMVEFESSWWMEDAARDTLIRARFACSTEEYYQALNELLDHPGALSFDPLVVRRLRRQRERRRRARLDGGSGDGATGERGGRNA